MNKTYLTPNKRCPELTIVPVGLKDIQGNKIKRKAILFKPNMVNVGQYTTSDPKEQEFIENHEWFGVGKIIHAPEDINELKGIVEKVEVSKGVTTAKAQEPISPVVKIDGRRKARVK